MFYEIKRPFVNITHLNHVNTNVYIYVFNIRIQFQAKYIAIKNYFSILIEKKNAMFINIIKSK